MCRSQTAAQGLGPQLASSRPLLPALHQTDSVISACTHWVNRKIRKVVSLCSAKRKSKVLDTQVIFGKLIFIWFVLITQFILRMKMGIFEEMKCQILAQAHLDDDCVQMFLSELQGVSEARKEQLAEKAQKAREDQSLYKMKTTKEIEESELKNAFPMYHKEFEDVAANQVYIVISFQKSKVLFTKLNIYRKWMLIQNQCKWTIKRCLKTTVKSQTRKWPLSVRFTSKYS